MTKPRWNQYVLLKGHGVPDFWNQHLADAARSVVVILGRGFDPRMCLGLEAVLAAGGSGSRDVIGLDFREGPQSPSLKHQDLVDANWQRVTGAVGTRGSVSIRPVEFWSEEGRRVSSQSARDLFASEDDLASYTDIVVDISSMPRSVYFPLIARVLYMLDNPTRSNRAANLHVLVAEDPALDAGIHEEGIDEKAEFMTSFGGGFDRKPFRLPRCGFPCSPRTGRFNSSEFTTGSSLTRFAPCCHRRRAIRDVRTRL